MTKPQELYKQGLEAEVELLTNELGRHGNAKSAAYAAVAAQYDFTNMEKQEDVVDCLTAAVIKYRQNLNMLPDDKNMTDEQKQDIEDHVLVEIERWGLSMSDIVKMFKNGKGADVVDQITRIYRQQDVRRKHDSWYAKKVHLPAQHAAYAEGFKDYHDEEDPLGIVQAELKDRMYKKLEERFDGLR